MIDQKGSEIVPTAAQIREVIRLADVVANSKADAFKLLNVLEAIVPNGTALFYILKSNI